MATADYGVRTCAALKFEKDVSPAQLAQQAGEEVELDTTREVVDVPDLRQAGDKEERVKGDEMKKDGDIGERCQEHLEPLSYKTLICKCWKGVRFHKLPKHNRSLKNTQQLYNHCAGARTVTRCLGSRKRLPRLGSRWPQSTSFAFIAGKRQTQPLTRVRPRSASFNWKPDCGLSCGTPDGSSLLDRRYPPDPTFRNVSLHVTGEG